MHPIISVIIPCFNNGQFLSKAIESVLSQGMGGVEVVVVDDGSSDNTAEVVRCFTGVKYYRQRNRGLSAARNKGVKVSKGNYLVFLDADDWLLPGALALNLSLLQKDSSLGLVAGAHYKFFEVQDKMELVVKSPGKDIYLALLKGNFIGAHCAVMFPRWVFKEFRYDHSLKACEDYDLCLRIARKYPCLYHTDPIAVYRIRNGSMSGNPALMLEYSIKVLHSQKSSLRTDEERAAFQSGLEFWKDYYVTEICAKLYHDVAILHHKADPSLLKVLYNTHRPKYEWMINELGLPPYVWKGEGAWKNFVSWIRKISP
ncbi:glycosyltransferase [Flavihumibacter rivuli]|uniref:glycosyltransferase n=1 Tax=Flavihumibacter rivuli TaxID=2838156 RepID=UPI001BDE8069|nr:glycosyltransferase [Flavihumibacter rivuli]ULQ56295.1 glycosyltransferase [Flavihumibacter rivuli]